MKIVFCIADYAGCGFYRTIQPAARLLAKGHEVSVLDQVSVDLLKAADVIFLQRQASEKLLKLLSEVKESNPDTIFIYDIDDYFHGITESNPAYGVVGNPKSNLLISMERFMEFSDVLTVSTEYLRDKYSRWNKNIVVVPNGVNADLFKYTSTIRQKRGINIGWHGSRTHYSDMEVVAKALKQVLKNNPEARLFFFGYIPLNLFLDVSTDRFSFYPETDIFNFPYTLSSLGIDIAIAPLVDSDFNRSKSCLKWLEFSAARIPVVASNVGPYKENIRDEIDGFLANNSFQWVSKIEGLLQSTDLRKFISRNAHERVTRDFRPDITVNGYEMAIKLGMEIKRTAKEPSRAQT